MFAESHLSQMTYSGLGNRIKLQYDPLFFFGCPVNEACTCVDFMQPDDFYVSYNCKLIVVDLGECFL